MISFSLYLLTNRSTDVAVKPSSVTAAEPHGNTATVTTMTTFVLWREPIEVWVFAQLAASRKASPLTLALENSNWRSSRRDFRLTVIIITSGTRFTHAMTMGSARSVNITAESTSYVARAAVLLPVVNDTISMVGVEASLGDTTSISMTSGILALVTMGMMTMMPMMTTKTMMTKTMMMMMKVRMVILNLNKCFSETKANSP